MSIEALLDRFVTAVETVAEKMVAERLHRERGGLGTPAHVGVAGLVDRVRARRIDGKEVQVEIEKLGRPELVKALGERGIDVPKNAPTKRMKKQLHEALMTVAEQDAVYAGTRKPAATRMTAVEMQEACDDNAIELKEKQKNEPTPVAEKPKTPEDTTTKTESPSGGAESPGPGDSRPVVEAIEFATVLDACKRYLSAVHKTDAEKGEAAIMGLMHKYNPDAKKLGDMMDHPRLREFYEEVLNI